MLAVSDAVDGKAEASRCLHVLITKASALEQGHAHYLGIEIDDALNMAEQIELWTIGHRFTPVANRRQKKLRAKALRRDLTLFNIAIENRLRDCNVFKLHSDDIVSGSKAGVALDPCQTAFVRTRKKTLRIKATDFARQQTGENAAGTRKKLS